MSNVGFRIYTEISRADREIVESFRGIPTGNIADNMGRLYTMSQSIRPISKVPLLGTAFTVKVPAGDNLMLHRAMHLAKPGDVLVVDGQGCMERSLAGEIMIKYAEKAGLAGIVIDGCIRDLDGLVSSKIAVYAKGATPCGPYKNGPGEIGLAVSCGGQVVFPGDIIAGDADGVVVIRQEDAQEIAKLSGEKLAAEQLTFKGIAEGAADFSWVEKSLEAQNVAEYNAAPAEHKVY